MCNKRYVKSAVVIVLSPFILNNDGIILWKLVAFTRWHTHINTYICILFNFAEAHSSEAIYEFFIRRGFLHGRTALNVDNGSNRKYCQEFNNLYYDKLVVDLPICIRKVHFSCLSSLQVCKTYRRNKKYYMTFITHCPLSHLRCFVFIYIHTSCQYILWTIQCLHRIHNAIFI